MNERDFLSHVQVCVRGEASLSGTKDVHEVCEIANEFLCSYGSAMEMPKIYVAYVSGTTSIEIDALGSHSVYQRRPKKPSRP